MSASDGLFAAKGQARPVDEARGDADDPAERNPVASGASDDETTPLPDLFGEAANDQTASSSGGIDDDAGDPEPLPAASLLTIISQRSAAKRRHSVDGRSKSPSPDSFTEDQSAESLSAPDEPGAGTDSRTATTDSSPQSTNLPVPVPIQLPMVGDRPAPEKRKTVRRIVALAACLALSLAGAAAILIAGAEDDTMTTAKGEAPLPPKATTPDQARNPTIGAVSDKTVGTVGALPIAIPEPQTNRIDSVRIETDGLAVISGQAPPQAELIVLHNRQPLGTARSNGAGTWSFSARVPTQTSRNEISIVPMRIDNSVVVTELPDVPRPGRRPAIPSYYFAQIASLPSAADAGREAGKLAGRLSGIVATHEISVRIATLADNRKVYRVAVGGFSTKAGAAEICDRIRARNTSCLVMRSF